MKRKLLFGALMGVVVMVSVLATSPAHAEFIWRQAGTAPFMGAVPDLQALDRALRTNAAQIRVVLQRAEAGMSHEDARQLTESILNAPTEGRVEEIQVQHGARYEWMAFGPNATRLERDVRWAGSQVLDGYIIHAPLGSREYRFFIPKACGNLAKIDEVPLAAPALPPAAAEYPEYPQERGEMIEYTFLPLPTFFVSLGWCVPVCWDWPWWGPVWFYDRTVLIHREWRHRHYRHWHHRQWHPPRRDRFCGPGMPGGRGGAVTAQGQQRPTKSAVTGRQLPPSYQSVSRPTARNQPGYRQPQPQTRRPAPSFTPRVNAPISRPMAAPVIARPSAQSVPRVATPIIGRPAPAPIARPAATPKYNAPAFNGGGRRR